MTMKLFINDVSFEVGCDVKIVRDENDVRRRFNDSPKHILPFLIEIESIRSQVEAN